MPASDEPPRHFSDPLATLFLLLSVLALVLALGLVRLSSELALRPFFGSVASSLFASPSISLIDFLFVPTIVYFARPHLPDLNSALVLGAALVYQYPTLLYHFTHSYPSAFKHPAWGAVILQLLAQWPTRLLGMGSCVVDLQLSSWRGLRSAPSLLSSALMAMGLNVLSRLTSPMAEILFDYMGPCEMFQRISFGLIAMSAIRVVSHFVLFRRHSSYKLTSALALGSLLVYAFSAQPKNLCHELSEQREVLLSTERLPYKVLARRLSSTGLVLVGELQLKDHGSELRFLRCDHSILGGIWIGHQRQLLREQLGSASTVAGPELDRLAAGEAESIYPTFNLQEAIRLFIKPSQEHLVNPRPSSRALIIGLGVGISARALIRHGVVVTIVEIDPVVYEYARSFFGLPIPEGGVFIEDARTYLRRPADDKLGLFDYVIHDVFTGGAVPAALFTLECWQDIRSHLRWDGVLAVNFAGKPRSEAGTLIFSTLFHVFPYCRAFIERTDTLPTEEEFQNMVIFCSPSGTPQFRSPSESDVFGSRHRYNLLKDFQRFEFDLNRPVAQVNLTQVFQDKDSARLERAQTRSALSHWSIMRDVLPPSVWAEFY